MIKDHYLRFQGFYVTFLVLIFVGLGSYYFVHFGYYPVAVVNGHFIAANSLSGEYTVAYQYYAVTLANQKQVDIFGADFKKELRRASMNDLIQKALIAGELQKRVGSDVDKLVVAKINEQNFDPQSVSEAAKSLYGLNLADFKEMVLMPQAQKEILESRLAADKQTFDAWLADAEKSAKVFILTPEFFWDKDKVSLRSN